MANRRVRVTLLPNNEAAKSRSENDQTVSAHATSRIQERNPPMPCAQTQGSTGSTARERNSVASVTSQSIWPCSTLRTASPPLVSIARRRCAPCRPVVAFAINSRRPPTLLEAISPPEPGAMTDDGSRQRARQQFLAGRSIGLSLVVQQGCRHATSRASQASTQAWSCYSPPQGRLHDPRSVWCSAGRRGFHTEVG